MSEALHRLATADPTAEALVDEHRSWTRGEVDAAADRLAHVLMKRGVAPGGRIAWMMHNRAEVALLALAAQRLGAVTVSLSYRSTADEMRRLLRVAAPDVVVTEDACRDIAQRGGAHAVLDVDDPAFEAAVAAAPSTAVRPPPGATDRMGAGASMLFTSGTTGEPKAALRAHGDPRLAAAVAAAIRFDTGQRYLASGPLYHSGPWSCALMALSYGGTIGFLREFDPRRWLEFARAHAMSATFITPTQLRHLVHAVEGGASAPATLSAVVVSGEVFPNELKERALRVFGPVFVESYGATELGPLTFLPAEEMLARKGSSGRPFPGVDVVAFDGDVRLPPGEVGLLHARTPLAFDGYVGASAPVGSGPTEWTSVGDLGYVDDDGYVYLVGRADDMIISGGVNVFPADVEAALRRHPAIVDCAVFGQPDGDWGQAVCAAVVATGDLSLHEVRSWLRGRIADDKRPRRLFRVASLPTTGTGKVARHALRDLATG